MAGNAVDRSCHIGVNVSTATDDGSLRSFARTAANTGAATTAANTHAVGKKSTSLDWLRQSVNPLVTSADINTALANRVR